jgi:hypothetical protein
MNLLDRAQLEEDLRSSEEELGDLLITAAAIEGNLTLAEAQVAALDRRIQALEEEQVKNNDVRTLVRLGSSHTRSHLADSDCPTCHQSLSNVETQSLGPVLEIDETVALLGAQISTAQAMKAQAASAAEQARGSLSALQRETDAARTRVQALREDLVAPSHYPSTGQIARRVTAQVRVDELDRTIDLVGSRLQELQEIADAIADARSRLDALPSGVPVSDVDRIGELSARLQAILDAFGFDSYAASSVIVDPDTLRPDRAGYDIETDVSASDVVRIKIAYLQSIRELSLEDGGPHPGFLLLDEPRQHELDEEHFRATLTRLAVGGADTQTIATSAASGEVLRQLVGSNNFSLIDLGRSRLLHPEGPENPLDFD